MQKSPDLKFKYVKGLGDFVACILHSKPIGWLTKFITGKDKPCMQCNRRREALNILVPFRMWKWFFKDEDDLLSNLAAEYRASDYKVSIDYEKKTLSFSKAYITHNK